MTVRRVPGSLEASVLQRLWGSPEPLTSRSIRDAIDDGEQPGMTTILTVLDRLQKKGLVLRTAGAGVSLFEAVRSDSTDTASAMGRLLERADDREAALLRFAGQLDSTDVEALRKALSPR
ncbi:MAG: BlaI/MecI/CopY family transcriptional regulator [Pseudolysinimonas sp.]